MGLTTKLFRQEKIKNSPRTEQCFYVLIYESLRYGDAGSLNLDRILTNKNTHKGIIFIIAHKAMN